MTAPTPGQAAHDAWCAEADWDELDDEARALWEDAAQAAITVHELPGYVTWFRVQLTAVTAERDDLKRKLGYCETDLRTALTVAESWPRCPDGCGCLMGRDDAADSECGCDGPCAMECRENGYPDAASYRDIALADLGATVRELVGYCESLGTERNRYRAALERIAADSAPNVWNPNAHDARKALEDS